MANGCESNVLTDKNNCGACGVVCGAGKTCTNGVCLVQNANCHIVNGVNWCFDPNNCGQACNQVCASLGLPFTINDATWFAAQDTLAECTAISQAFGIAAAPSMASYTYACLEDTGGGGNALGGLLLCSTYNGTVVIDERRVSPHSVPTPGRFSGTGAASLSSGCEVGAALCSAALPAPPCDPAIGAAAAPSPLRSSADGDAREAGGGGDLETEAPKAPASCSAPAGSEGA